MKLEDIKLKIIPILDKYDVSKAPLFGSIARGEDTQDSDIDLLVGFEGEKSLLDLASLKIDLEGLLGRGVDVLIYDFLHPLLKERILKEQRAIL